MTALHRQAGQLLSGGASAFRARLASLQGHPVVVNQWASWCGPCRYEFPFFDRLARRYAGRVAFVGVDSLDSSSAARSFLSRHRVPYAHYADPDGKVARVFHGGRLFPTTAFYDADGELVATHAGAYRDARALDIDIRRYALDG